MSMPSVEVLRARWQARAEKAEKKRFPAKREETAIEETGPQPGLNSLLHTCGITKSILVKAKLFLWQYVPSWL